MLKKCICLIGFIVALNASATEHRHLILSDDGYVLSCKLGNGIFTDCYPHEIDMSNIKEKNKQYGQRKVRANSKRTSR